MNATRSWIVLVIVLLCAGPAAVHAQGKGGKGGGGQKGQCIGGTKVTDPFYVVATFSDTLDGNTTRIQGDGGPYDGSWDGSARIICTGEIEIASYYNNSGRDIFLDFTDPAPPPRTCDPCILPQIAADFGPFLFRTNVMPNDGDPTEKDGALVGGAFAIPRGQSRLSRIKVNFSTSDGDLTLRFKPDEFTQTSWATVTRIRSIEVDGQDEWVVQAVSPNDVAKAMTPDYQLSTRGKQKGHDEGNFHMPFRVVVTHP